MIDIKSIRRDFPILGEKINGHPLVYVDSANTSLTPSQVVEKMNEYYEDYNANIHRSVYPLSERATTEYEAARDLVRSFINARSRQEVIFTRNATESINLVTQTWGRQHLKVGDSIVLSIMEHHSNIVSWQLLQRELGFQIHYISLTDDGRLNEEAYKRVLKRNKVKLVSLIHQSNVLGTINDVQKLSKIAHDGGAKVLIDAAQSVPHMTVDFQAIDADFLVLTGHKMLGPTGIGALIARQEMLEQIPPFLGGGDMIRSVTINGSQWNELPYKFEAGTPNIAGAIGLGAAVNYLQSIGMKEVHAHEQLLLRKALIALQEVEGVKILGPKDMAERGAAVSFTLDGVHPHDAATLLGERGICVRAGNHCAQPLHDYLGIPASIRISFYVYNTENEIDALVAGLRDIKKTFKI